MGRGYIATWPLGLVARGQSNLMRLHWGEKKRKIMMRGGRESVRKGQWEILHHSVYTSSGPWQQSNTYDLCTSSPLTGFFQLVKKGLVEKGDFSGMSTCLVHSQDVHIDCVFLNFGIC